MRAFVALALLTAACHHRRPSTPADDAFRRPIDAPAPSTLPDDDGFRHPIDDVPPSLLRPLPLSADLDQAREPIWDMSALPGALVLAERGYGVLTVNPDNGEALRNLGFPEVQQVASRDGLVLVGEYEALHAVDAATGAVRWTATIEENPRELVFMPDGGSVLAAVHNRVERRDAATGALRWAWTASPAKNDGDINTVTTLDVTPDGLTVIAHDGAQVISLVAETGTRTREITRLGDTVFAVGLSPDGSLLVAGSMARDLVLVDFRAGKVLRSFTTPGWVVDVAWSPDGRFFATLDLSGHVEVRDASGETTLEAAVEGSSTSGLLWTETGLLVWSDDRAWTWR
jgi:WD40 repeat protein